MSKQIDFPPRCAGPQEPPVPSFAAAVGELAWLVGEGPEGGQQQVWEEVGL